MSKGIEQDEAGSKKERRNMLTRTCPELGVQLETFELDNFDHIHHAPQCLDQVRPRLTLYTRDRSTHGCNLTPQEPSVGRSYYDIPSNCYNELQSIPKVVFLVHGFSLLNSQLEEYMDMKTDILKSDQTGVIVVDWYEGSKVDLNFLKNSA